MRRLGTLADIRAHAIDPAHQHQVEIGVAAKVVVDAAAPFDQARQDVVDVLDRKRIIHGVVGDRAFLSGTMTVPLLARGITLAAEQDDLALRAPGHQRQHRFGFTETGQVVEIAVLAKGVVGIVVAQAFGGRGHDDDRIAAGHAHQLLAPADMLVAANHQCRHRLVAAAGRRAVGPGSSSACSSKTPTRTNSSTSASAASSSSPPP